MGNNGGKLWFTDTRNEERVKIPERSLSSSSSSSSGSSSSTVPYSSTVTNPITIAADIPPFTCETCVEPKPLNDSFNVKKCSHFYCTQCIIKYIVSKLEDNILTITCPESGCKGVLEPSYCKPILPKKVLLSWQKALAEAAIPERVKFYCPFRDCSALLINEGSRRGQVIRESVCPHCKRTICVQCKAPWHSELTCAKFQKMNHSNDKLLVDLVNRRDWKICPNCKQYVEKKSGCNFIRCRCHHAFCYECGSSYKTYNFLTSCKCGK